MKQNLIAGNWKMNLTAAEADAFARELKPLVAQYKGVEIAVCVPFTDLAVVKKALRGSKIRLGAQNVSWAERGAFTGEISADMLLESGVKYVIIGHSERRQYFGETDETVNKRTAFALSKGIRVILCVGESEAEREQGRTEEVLKQQTLAALKGIGAELLPSIVIAYEPVWAIGTGKTATPEDANATIGFIRGLISQMYGSMKAADLRILYGGSMNAANADSLMAMQQIDGGLIGGASLKTADFAAIVKSAV